MDTLVAGCGTGRHSTETAHLYRGARVLAIDLSARSLAYALRQTQALGSQRPIEYKEKRIKIFLGFSQPYRVPRESWTYGINQSKCLSGVVIEGRICELFHAVELSKPFALDRFYRAILQKIHQRSAQPMAYNPSSDPKPRFLISTQEAASLESSRVLVTFEIGSVADARFLKDQPRPTFDVPKRIFTSSQAEHLLQLIGLALHDCKIPGAETAVQMLRFVEDGELGSRRQLVLLAPTSDDDHVEHAVREEQITKAIAPLIAHLVEDGGLLRTSDQNRYEEYSPEVREHAQMFLNRYAGKKSAEPMEITVGSTRCASITGGVWKSSEHVDIPDEHTVALAVCNGWKCDERIVFLKEVKEHKVTKNKYEAFFDQRLHQDMIRDAAGRPDRVLKISLRKETTPKKVVLHVQHVEIAPSNEHAFELHVQ